MGWHSIVEHYAAHPEALRRLHPLSERLAALAHQPIDPAVLRELADDFQAYQREHPFPTALLPAFADPEQPFARVFGDLLRAQLDPAQQQLMTLLHDTPGSPGPADPPVSDRKKGVPR